MDFVKKEWQFRDLISENELNRMEDGIEEGITKAEQAQQIANEAKTAADTAQSDISAHISATTGVHGATSAATPNTIIQRDPSGRAKVAAPAASDDIARKDTVDAVQINLTNHIADYVRQPGYAVATGSANTYAVTLNPAPTAYVDGMAVAVKINVDNTGASTLNVNGLGAKPIKKPNGNDVAAGNLKAGSIYTFRYNANTGNFILQAEGSGGNAQPADVLTGKTFTNDAGEQVGTMPNRGNVSQTLTNQGQEYTIPAGYHAGGGKVTANITNLTAANIKYGVTVGGVAGTFSQTANGASAGQILSGREAFVNGAQVIGTMPNRTGHVTGQSISRSGTTLRIRPQAGYYPGDSGNSVAWSDPNWIATNIRKGVSIFGLAGSLIPGGEPIASGKKVTSTSTGNTRQFVRDDGTTTNEIYIEVSGLALPFEPNLILAVYKGGALPPILTIFSRDGLSDFYGTSQGKIMMCRAQYSIYSNSAAIWYRLDGSAVVTTTSFRLPVTYHAGTSGGNLFYWFIWG